MKCFIKNIEKAKILITFTRIKTGTETLKYNKIDMIVKPINQSINLSIYQSISQ